MVLDLCIFSIVRDEELGIEEPLPIRRRAVILESVELFKGVLERKPHLLLIFHANILL
jgi:hypothetical protein